MMLLTFSTLKCKIKIERGSNPRLRGEGGQMHTKIKNAAICRMMEISYKYTAAVPALHIIKGAV